MVNPNYHTPSHLTLGEIESALNHAGVSPGDLFAAVLASLRVLSNTYGQASRLVFWFQ